MEENAVQSAIREKLGLRVGPEMAAYVLRQLEAGNQTIGIIGGDARTGVARRTELAAALFREAPQIGMEQQRP